MARKRVISQNMTLMAGPSPATGSHTNAVKELFQLQSLDWNYSAGKQDVLVFGQAAALTRDTLEDPDANISFSYLSVDLQNEKTLGFVVDGTSGAFSKIINTQQSERNYFIPIAAEGNAAVGSTGADVKVVGMGNGFLSSYSLEAAVGSYPTVTTAVKGLQFKNYANGTAQIIPALDGSGAPITNTGSVFTIPTISGGLAFTGSRDAIIRPGDITIDLSGVSGLFYNYGNIGTQNYVQSFNISTDFNLESLKGLGNKYSTSREFTFPVPINFTFDARTSDLNTSAQLSDVLCNTGLFNVNITMKRPSCTPGGGSTAIYYQLKNMSLEGEAVTTPLGNGFQSVSVTMLGNIGAANDTLNGLFMSGISH